MFGPRSWQPTRANEAISLGWQNYTVSYADTGSGVVLLSNSDNFESVARELVAAALPYDRSPFDWLGYPVFDPGRRREPPPQPVAIELEAELLERYVGDYRLPGDRTLAVRLEGGSLWISEAEEEPERLLAATRNEFFIAGEDTRFRFELSGSGRVERLLILVEGLELAATPLIGPSED